jgi:cell division protein FtsN
VEVRKLILGLSVWLVLASCQQKKSNSSYRIVGRDGKVIYVEKKVPKFNREYLAKKKSDGGEDGSQTRASQEGYAGGKGTASNVASVGASKMLASSAYSLRSVMDGTVSQDSSLESSAEDLGRMKNTRTIIDFDYLPSSYFSDDRDVQKNQAKTMVGSAPVSTEGSRRTTRDVNSGGLYYIQLGLFLSRDNAEKLLRKFNSIVPNLKIMGRKASGGRDSYRVVGGGFARKVELEKMERQIRNNGHSDIHIFRE